MTASFKSYLQAGYSCLWVNTLEPGRAQQVLGLVAMEVHPDVAPLHWDISQGIVNLATGVVTACPSPVEALKLACARLGLEFMEGQRHYKWYGHYAGGSPLPQGFGVDDLGKCTHAIVVPGAGYEIGVQHWGDGTFKLLWDSWGAGGLEKALGKDCNLLRQAYGVEAAKLEAQRQGYSVWEQTQEDGSIKLHVQVGA